MDGMRVLPPSTRYFSTTLLSYGAEHGTTVPGMHATFRVRIAPDSLADYDVDFVVVQTEVESYPLPLHARRSPPVLTLPSLLQCGFAVVGGTSSPVVSAQNTVGVGRFFVLDKRSADPRGGPEDARARHWAPTSSSARSRSCSRAARSSARRSRARHIALHRQRGGAHVALARGGPAGRARGALLRLGVLLDPTMGTQPPAEAGSSVTITMTPRALGNLQRYLHVAVSPHGRTPTLRLEVFAVGPREHIKPLEAVAFEP
jgi:hypothetical protein